MSVRNTRQRQFDTDYNLDIQNGLDPPHFSTYFPYKVNLKILLKNQIEYDILTCFLLFYQTYGRESKNFGLNFITLNCLLVITLVIRTARHLKSLSENYLVLHLLNK